MSADASHADERRAFHAPDGITILPFAMSGLAHDAFVAIVQARTGMPK